MTLAQLQSFVLVARHGSVKAAAAELGVTEPAVSVAVAALRKELGDDLFVRDGRAIALTSGGRRLAALATEILALAEQARQSVKDAPAQARLMQVAVAGMVAEHVGPLLEAFIAREADAEVSVEPASGRELPDLLEHRRADIALGPPPAPERAATIATVAFLRARLIVVAAPSHPLAGRQDVAATTVAGHRWLLGPPELDPSTGPGLLFARMGDAPVDVVAYTSHAAALAAAAAGDGLVVTVAHGVIDQFRRRSLVRIDVRGTPMVELWHASTLGFGRALPAALALQRFATSPEATQAISSGRAGTAPARARARPHVTLWSSVAAEGRGNANTEPSERV
jgi:LysR family transcriptional regulator, low CO2-responsive transcriptional regulator